MTPPLFLDAGQVAERLSLDVCTGLMREAMQALSGGEVEQALRSFLKLGEGRTFALMPAGFVPRGPFGAKLVSVFADPDHSGRRTHEGLVILFDGQSGAPVCVVDGGAVTRIRTAAASAAATDALARPDASRLAIFGTGVQAHTHALAIAHVRKLEQVIIWGRDKDRAGALAARLASELNIDAVAEPDPARAAGADIICTVTASAEPVLKGEWLRPGTHVNLAGSSGPHAAEADGALVAAARFIADHREHVLAHGGEFLRARQAGLIGDGHIAAEIGEVYAGTQAGRTRPGDITIYKSLGHAVQDLAAVAWLYNDMKARGEG
ncbi:MAG: ornithine cyclodeaminase family protein [Oceanicaulis sp.]|uniref:ornithine cyclodeaminase family protein n=1 Tax=Glycocaulis sp. TaxID=1969725 RepID=UPI0025BDE44A|nr:ornithine cyclodeaminase family protein [Glycocaulis sp.]MCC5980575.1 ornithine cyclodeaminase family protein [Oceanicaulis sp.]MCH8522476.1 ornithine cyclodeaminase family protein [Glycocaulis sp.]